MSESNFLHGFSIYLLTNALVWQNNTRRGKKNHKSIHPLCKASHKDTVLYLCLILHWKQIEYIDFDITDIYLFFPLIRCLPSLVALRFIFRLPIGSFLLRGEVPLHCSWNIKKIWNYSRVIVFIYCNISNLCSSFISLLLYITEKIEPTWPWRKKYDHQGHETIDMASQT